MGETLLKEERPAPHVRRLVLDDPGRRNALGLDLRAALADALGRAAAESDCRVVIVTGTGRAFASGSDIAMLAAMEPLDLERPEVRGLWETLRDYPKPIVAALNGHALGGGLELALAGDVILAVPEAKLGTPEAKLGIMPGGGATQRLVRALGTYRALRLLLTAEPIDAATAERWGLVTEIAPAEALEERALAVAELIAALPPRAIRAIREVVRAGADLPLDAGIALEKRAFQLLFASADRREGMAAFLEKRPPHFTGE